MKISASIYSNKKRSLKDLIKELDSVKIDMFHVDFNDKKKAVGFEVTIQSYEKTLTDDEINEISENIISKVKKKYNAKLR